MRIRCINNVEHGVFVVTAHVAQAWVVGKDGVFRDCVDECMQVTHRPDSEDIYVCEECGAEAEVTE